MGCLELKLSYHVLELSLKCNQDSNNVHFQLHVVFWYTLVTNDYLNGHVLNKKGVSTIKIYVFLV